LAGNDTITMTGTAGTTGAGGTDVLVTANGIPGLTGIGGASGITVVCFA